MNPATLKIEEFLARTIVRLESRLEVLLRKSARYSWLRLAIFIVGTVWVGYFYSRDMGNGVAISTLVFVAVFLAAVKSHNRIIRSIRRHRIAVSIKQTHIARIHRDWESIENRDPAGVGASHPFSRDLDLTGQRSLQHLIDTSFSRGGSDRVREWLLETRPDPQESEQRQKLIGELVPLSSFQDRISLLSAEVSKEGNTRFDGDRLLAWLGTHRIDGRFNLILWLLGTLAVLTPILVGFRVTGFTSTNFWVYSLGTYVVVYFLNFRLYEHLFDEAEHLYSELNLFRPVLKYLERFRFSRGSELESLAAPFKMKGQPPSAYLKQVMWLSMAASAQKNDVARIVLNLLLPWEMYFARKLELYKVRLRDRLPQWLNALHTFEAAGAFATFGYLNPDFTFATLDSSASTSLLESRGLGHPLIEPKERIANDFDIDSLGDLALVTGSNMSGKSTFLRTVGINLVLARVGAPVNATFLKTAPVRLFTCINVSDSVNDGISYFYAEVKRLKNLLDELEKPDEYPLMYLIDEVFRGTNNRERLQGSRSLLRSLCKLEGAGIVSTHDLELTELSDHVSSMSNYHFREHISEGKMVFDYLLRTGPSPTTNALTIMKMEGLIDDEGEASA